MLAILPEGTSLLVDAGASGTRGPAMNAARPDESRRPGEWIARYVDRQLKTVVGTSAQAGLDYAVVTHLHGDHIGDVTAASPLSGDGSYRLTGISDVAEAIRIDTLIDRAYPAYDHPVKVQAAPARNYIAFVQSAVRRGMRAERVQVGSAKQIVLRRAAERYPEFDARMIAGNAAVWTGTGDQSKALFPPNTVQPADEVTAENNLSIALRLSYGKFSYFTGGDLNCDTNYGRDPWRDVESSAARAAGPVSVATCDHHGYFDACGPEFVRALRPQAWILQSWHASHPAIATLANLYSSELYPGLRDIFCLGLHPAAALACGRFSDRFKSSQGHVLVRVAPGGGEYSILVLDDGDEKDTVKAAFGPYLS